MSRYLRAKIPPLRSKQGPNMHALLPKAIDEDKNEKNALSPNIPPLYPVLSLKLIWHLWEDCKAHVTTSSLLTQALHLYCLIRHYICTTGLGLIREEWPACLWSRYLAPAAPSFEYSPYCTWPRLQLARGIFPVRLSVMSPGFRTSKWLV